MRTRCGLPLTRASTARRRFIRVMVSPCRTRRQRCSKNSWPTPAIRARNRLCHGNTVPADPPIRVKLISLRSLVYILLQQIRPPRVSPMRLEPARAFFAEKAPDIAVIESTTSSATVVLAAEAYGVEPARIGKTLSLRVGERVGVVVTRGT